MFGKNCPNFFQRRSITDVRTGAGQTIRTEQPIALNPHLHTGIQQVVPNKHMGFVDVDVFETWLDERLQSSTGFEKLDDRADHDIGPASITAYLSLLPPEVFVYGMRQSRWNLYGAVVFRGR